jgi:hypothetical protein
MKVEIDGRIIRVHGIVETENEHAAEGYIELSHTEARYLGKLLAAVVNVPTTGMTRKEREAEAEAETLAIPIRLREEQVSVEAIEAGLRRQGWTDDMLGPDMKACLTEIAEGLDKLRQEDIVAQDYGE